MVAAEPEGETQFPGATIDTLSADHRPRTTSARILLADDNADMRRYVQRILKPYYEVQTVNDGEAALAAIERMTPDLVLKRHHDASSRWHCDVESDSSEPEYEEACPVVLLTARADEESTVQGMGSGANDYLANPSARRNCWRGSRGISRSQRFVVKLPTSLA